MGLITGTFWNFFLGALSSLAALSHLLLNCRFSRTSLFSMSDMTATSFWTEHLYNQSFSCFTILFWYFISSYKQGKSTFLPLISDGYISYWYKMLLIPNEKDWATIAAFPCRAVCCSWVSCTAMARSSEEDMHLALHTKMPAAPGMWSWVWRFNFTDRSYDFGFFVFPFPVSPMQWLLH